MGQTTVRWARCLLGLAASVMTSLGWTADRVHSEVLNVDLSSAAPHLASAVPVVAVDPRNGGHIAVAWRAVDPTGGPDAHTSNALGCHVSLSDDGGTTFRDQVIEWGIATYPRCNAPWVAYSKNGELYVAATLTGAPPAHEVAPSDTAPAVRPHPDGTVALMTSRDGGEHWSTAVAVIPSHAVERFETDASIPITAKQVPWDGARGAVDQSTGTLFLSGAFPAPPGSAERSQRFYTVSSDAGMSFGPIRSFGTSDWPERWDGDIAAARGVFIASYIAETTPDAARQCPCAVAAVSEDGGKTLQHYFIAEASQFDLDMLVHYPQVSADRAHRGRFAAVLVSAQRGGISVVETSDAGAHWITVSVTQPSDVTAVSRPAVAFSATGLLVAAWRGVHRDGSYDMYAAGSRDGTRFGQTVKVSTVSSRTPEAWQKTYAVRGDFHTALDVGGADVHVAWADARTLEDVRVVYGRLPLRMLLQ